MSTHATHDRAARRPRRARALRARRRVRLVDRITTPGSPRVLRGREEIAGWIEDVCARDMTHRVEQEVLGDGRAAFAESCRYPDGTNVLCMTVLEVADGRMVSRLAIEAWDE